MNIDIVYKKLKKHLDDNEGKLGFEFGCVCGYVSDIKLTDNEIQLIGKAGFDNEEKILCHFNERTKRNSFKYWPEFKTIELYEPTKD